ncbi:MAG: magnesium/cobalt transporter CorA [Trueperaceae bacterium]|nr:MAG: magnesium/cobalt transporter CorA [Trueperaceae bacterium]
MLRVHQGRASKAGLAPGSVVYTGEVEVETVTIELFRYDEGQLTEHQVSGLEQALALREPGQISWYNITGLHETELIQAFGEAFGLHPLVREDIASVGQRPKVELFEAHLFIVLRMLSLTEDGSPQSEQLSLVLGPDYVLTFQERPGDVFAPVRERLRRGKGRMRKLGADYLAYALIDVIVDSYFSVLEHYGDTLEELEEEILREPTPHSLERVNRLRRELLFLRKSIWPLRELMGTLQREESPVVSAVVVTFLRDAYDHSIQVIDTVETFREVLSGLHDFYLTSLSFKMNEVMKVLTIIATIFIPLGFLVGVYGMNFDVMPELHLRWGYPALWLFMVTLVAAMLVLFRRRRWL